MATAPAGSVQNKARQSDGVSFFRRCEKFCHLPRKKCRATFQTFWVSALGNRNRNLLSAAYRSHPRPESPSTHQLFTHQPWNEGKINDVPFQPSRLTTPAGSHGTTCDGAFVAAMGLMRTTARTTSRVWGKRRVLDLSRQDVREAIGAADNASILFRGVLATDYVHG